MKDLLSFLINKITNSSEFEISETEEEGRVIYNVKSDPSIIGLIIGKSGRTIKNIRKILSVRAVLEGKSVAVSVEEK
ncbi:MAG TPA: KH domain-containing protein [Patescibacteria group bacterium]